jgi:predicted dehydrogenase
LDLTETQQVVRVVQEHKVPVQLGFMRRYYPGYAKAKTKIEAGKLGKLQTFRALSRELTRPAKPYYSG